MQYQTYPWAYIHEGPGVSAGAKGQAQPFKLGTIPQIPAEGFLGNISTFYHVSFAEGQTDQFTVDKAQLLPFFDKTNGDVNGMDNLLKEKIQT
jgi:hypothetical protein